jgi:hypothetical protein
VSILECATVGEAYAAAAGSIRVGRCFLALPDPRADRPVHHFIGGAAHALAASRHLGKMTMQEPENTAALLGRVAMSVIFIHGGWGKLLAPVATQAMLAGHHLPMVQLGWLLAIVVELGGGRIIGRRSGHRPIPERRSHAAISADGGKAGHCYSSRPASRSRRPSASSPRRRTAAGAGPLTERLRIYRKQLICR